MVRKNKVKVKKLISNAVSLVLFVRVLRVIYAYYKTFRK
jgi:hypothetical protein